MPSSPPVDELFESVYGHLRAMAAAISRSEERQLAQPTSLVHETWLRMAGSAHWNDERHFHCIAAQAMRQVLRDRARARRAGKRGGGWLRVTLAELGEQPRVVDEIALNDALEGLEQVDPELARVVELRIFAGLAHREVAEVLGMNERSVERRWRLARAWLIRRLDPAA